MMMVAFDHGFDLTSWMDTKFLDWAMRKKELMTQSSHRRMGRAGLIFRLALHLLLFLLDAEAEKN